MKIRNYYCNLTVSIDYFFRIYGDNILECELFVDWLKHNDSDFSFISEIGPIDRPIIIFKDNISKKIFGFHMTSFYGGTQNSIWPNSPLDGIFNEKPDVLIVKINSDYTESDPLFVIEFDDALQAGNQSWQRSRRAVDSAQSHIPYFYVLPLIGWEKGTDGLSLKNPRFQNAMVTTGQLVLSFQEGIMSLQIYKNSAWSDYANQQGHILPDGYGTFGGLSSAIKLTTYLIRSSVIKNTPFPKKDLQIIIKEMLNVAKTYSEFSETSLSIHKNHPALDISNNDLVTTQLVGIIFDKKKISNEFNLNEISSKEFFQNGSLFHKDAQTKTTTPNFQSKLLKKINWKSNDTKVNQIQWLKEWNVSIDNSLSPKENALKNKNLIPISYKDKKSESTIIGNRKILRKLIVGTYPKIEAEILDWIYSSKSSKEPIFFIPMNGYKPSGTSRPDTGLLAYLYSNFPKVLTKKNTMLVMYSKHTPINWKTILHNDSNQLFGSIKEYCGLIIVDRTGDGELL